jgi:uncharacterized protein YecT (DUF1311 family)
VGLLNLFSIVIFLFALKANAASFDCSKASNNAEMIICSDNDLGSYDLIIADIYKEVLNSAEQTTDKQKIKNDQLIWIRQRNKCKDNLCIYNSYSMRVKSFNLKRCSSKSTPGIVFNRIPPFESEEIGGWDILRHNVVKMDGKELVKGHLLTSRGNDFLGPSSEKSSERKIIFLADINNWKCD